MAGNQANDASTNNQVDPQFGSYYNAPNGVPNNFNPYPFIGGITNQPNFTPQPAQPKSNMLNKLKDLAGGSANNLDLQPVQNSFTSPQQQYEILPVAPIPNPNNPFVFNPNSINETQHLNGNDYLNTYNNQAQYYPQEIPQQISPAQNNFNPYNQFEQLPNQVTNFGQADYSTQFYSNSETNFQDFNNSFNKGALPVPVFNPINSFSPQPQFNPQQFTPLTQNQFSNSPKPEDFASFSGAVSKPLGNIQQSNVVQALNTQLQETKPISNFNQTQAHNNIVSKPTSLQATPSEKHLEIKNLKPDKVSTKEETLILQGVKLINAKGASAVVSAEGLFNKARMSHKKK